MKRLKMSLKLLHPLLNFPNNLLNQQSVRCNLENDEEQEYNNL